MSSKAQSLWSARTQYVGDGSRVVALVNKAGFGPQGSYRVALQTATTPYGMTVSFQRLDKPFDDVDFTEGATLLLGLVDNLDHVSVTSGEHAYSLSAAGASTKLGYDVKDLGRDQSRLTAYLGTTDD